MVTSEIPMEKKKTFFAVVGKRREDYLEIVPSGKSVQSFCLEEIYMKYFIENVSGMIVFAIRQRCGQLFYGNRREIQVKSLHCAE
jgi:hypothetical protein